MKIYFFGADYPPTGGGIATFTYELTRAVLQHHDVEKVNMLIFGNRQPRTEKINDKLQIIILSKINFLYVGWKILLVFLNSKDYGIFHSLNLFPIGFWVVFWGKIFRKKTAVTFYGTDACDTSASRKTSFLKAWTLKNVSSPITISNFTKQATEKKYKLDNKLIKVIYPIVPKALLSDNKNNDSIILDLKKRFNIDNGTFVIISVARLVKRKGTELLIKAVSKIKDNNIRLLIIGDGPERNNLEKIVSDLDLDNKIFILGKVDDIIPYYNMASVSILSSYIMVDDGDFEGLGLVLLEAQSYGVPVIGTKSGGIPEAFEENITGLLVKEYDIDDLANAIIKLKNNKELHRDFVNNTKSFLDKCFGFDATINKHIELYKSL